MTQSISLIERILAAVVCVLLITACTEKANLDLLPSEDQDTSTSTDTESPADDLPATDSTDSELLDLDEPKPCNCPAEQYCNPEEQCVADLCLQDTLTCNEAGQVVQCNQDGSAFEELNCSNEQVCLLGECKGLICTPQEAPTCEDGQIKHCAALGTEYKLTPCPAGSECKAGQCQPAQANVIFLVDSSSSMNFMVSNGKHPAACSGVDCPAWDFPNCDEPLNPKTRLGRAKAALRQVIENPVAQGSRLALQRFPQFKLAPFLAAMPTCNYTYFSDQTIIQGHNEEHALGEALLNVGLWEIMPHPLAANGTTDIATLLSWLDFDESISATEQFCAEGTDCPDKICVAAQCQEHTEPELRAMGKTSLGLSLFYAGEYLRHHVFVDGKSCSQDSDCGSPHHSCKDGKCHDAHADCRPTVIIVFSDGQETVNTDAADFFHPRIQAKRLHFGLGCQDSNDCTGGAVCTNQRCAPPKELDIPANLCHGKVKACEQDAECEPYPCGQEEDCPGLCESSSLDYADLEGYNVLRDFNGTPRSVLIHTVDANASVANGTNLIARLGGGLHVPVDYENIDDLAKSFLPLLEDLKFGDSACP